MSGVGAEHARALLADALFRQGRLGEARRELDAYMASSPASPLSDAVLHRWAVQVLADAYGEVPQRDEAEMSALLEKALSDADLDARRDFLCRAVSADPMAGLAWFNLAVAENYGAPAKSWREFLLAAILQEWDVEAWANAILIQLWTGFAELMIAAATVATASRIHGARLDAEILRSIKGSGATDETSLEVLAAVREAAKEMRAILRVRRYPSAAVHSPGSNHLSAHRARKVSPMLPVPDFRITYLPGFSEPRVRERSFGQSSGIPQTQERTKWHREAHGVD